jgi:hypothetical protein
MEISTTSATDLKTNAYLPNSLKELFKQVRHKTTHIIRYQ